MCEGLALTACKGLARAVCEGLVLTACKCLVTAVCEGATLTVSEDLIKTVLATNSNIELGQVSTASLI